MVEIIDCAFIRFNSSSMDCSLDVSSAIDEKEIDNKSKIDSFFIVVNVRVKRPKRRSRRSGVLNFIGNNFYRRDIPSVILCILFCILTAVLS